VKEFISSTSLCREMQLEQERIEAEKKRVRKIFHSVINVVAV
jgi:hypothetical protein